MIFINKNHNSDIELLIYADWLEEQSDDACQGIREFIIPGKYRPAEYVNTYGWFNCTFDRIFPHWVKHDCIRHLCLNRLFLAETYQQAIYNLAKAYVTYTNENRSKRFRTKRTKVQ